MPSSSANQAKANSSINMDRKKWRNPREPIEHSENEGAVTHRITRSIANEQDKKSCLRSSNKRKFISLEDTSQKKNRKSNVPSGNRARSRTPAPPGNPQHTAPARIPAISQSNSRAANVINQQNPASSNATALVRFGKSSPEDSGQAQSTSSSSRNSIQSSAQSSKKIRTGAVSSNPITALKLNTCERKIDSTQPRKQTNVNLQSSKPVNVTAESTSVQAAKIEQKTNSFSNRILDSDTNSTPTYNIESRLTVPQNNQNVLHQEKFAQPPDSAPFISNNPTPYYEERPRPPARKWHQIPQHDLSAVYTRFGDPNYELKGDDFLKTLSPNWFNQDMVMGSLQQLVNEEYEASATTSCVTFNAGTKLFLYTMKYWKSLEENELKTNCKNAVVGAGKSFNAFEKDLYVFPIMNEAHWMIIFIMHPKNLLFKKGTRRSTQNCYMYFLDPMGNVIEKRNNRVHLLITKFLEKHLEDLQVGKRKKFLDMQFSPSNLVYVKPKNVPLQTNLNDCAPFIVYYMEVMINPYHGILKQKDPNVVDFQAMAPAMSVDTIRHRIRSRILKSTKNKAARVALQDIVEYELQRKQRHPLQYLEHLSGRRSRSQCRIRDSVTSTRRRRCYSEDNKKSTVEGKWEHIYRNNPAKVAAHPVSEDVQNARAEPFPDKGQRTGLYYTMYH
ncbi:hypothetical protein CAEBREN_24021 [Caenorhabditis brenneri]|uniref:Ubiquitin-like protease family profile domain-containing protein n=1 Tax=Caenorhabditis brenneri TaxID=135651 RepID=G0NKU6_CAEBE|nr:hypothetical protein CAEBREN_24021 [Caenorhabditis brenneri]